MEKVKKALKILIDGESSAVKMYSKYSDIALNEGFGNISILFRSLAMAEKIHIKNHFNALGEEYTPVIDEDFKTETTLENIKEALNGEMEENKSLYPKLVKSIKKECKSHEGKVARLSMIWAQKVEKEHAKLLKRALKSIKQGKDFTFNEIYICQVCGNVVLDRKSEKECEVCGHDTLFFKSVRGDS